MQCVEDNAGGGPHPQHALPHRFFPFEPEDPYCCHVHAIQDLRARCKVVQLLGQIVISRVENHAEYPTGHPKISKRDIISPQSERRRYLFADLDHAPAMGQVVEEREDNAERLLHAEEAVERPFSVELMDGLSVRRVVGEAFVRHDMLA